MARYPRRSLVPVQPLWSGTALFGICPETDAARIVLERLAGPLDARAVLLAHEGTPIVKARARFNHTQQRFYTPEKTRLAQQDLAWAFRFALQGRAPLPDRVAIVAWFYVPTRQPKDLDNLLKLVMDAGTKARAWCDDRQVRALATFVELDPVRPRTVIALGPYVGLPEAFRSG